MVAAQQHDAFDARPRGEVQVPDPVPIHVHQHKIDRTLGFGDCHVIGFIGDTASALDQAAARFPVAVDVNLHCRCKGRVAIGHQRKLKFAAARRHMTDDRPFARRGQTAAHDGPDGGDFGRDGLCHLPDMAVEHVLDENRAVPGKGCNGPPRDKPLISVEDQVRRRLARRLAVPRRERAPPADGLHHPLAFQHRHHRVWKKAFKGPRPKRHEHEQENRDRADNHQADRSTDHR